MYKYRHFIPENIAPKEAKAVGVFDETGNRVCSIPLGRLAQPQLGKMYSFLALSDVHIQYNTASADLQRALTYAENNCDFTCICGDLTDTGSDEQLAQYKSIVDTYAKTKPIYAVGGNHETRLAYMTYDGLTPYTGYPMYYSFTKGDDVFVMLSHYGKYEDGVGWRASEFVSVEELQWLYETLEENRNKRCFIFNHAYPWDDGVGDANRYYGGKQWDTKDGSIGQAFINLLKHYKNTVLFHGHSHLRYYLQEADKKANYSGSVGYRSVHISSLAVPRDRVDGTTTTIYAESEGYVVDVYNDYIILNGRDFIDNDADGHILPIATYKVDTPLVPVEEGTFADSTGTITTSGLPSAYQEVEWVKGYVASTSSGAYIDLGFAFDTAATIYLEGSSEYSSSQIFGAAESSGKYRCMITLNSTKANAYGYNGTNYNAFAVAAALPGDFSYRYVLKPGLLEFENLISGEKNTGKTQVAYTMTRNLYLFAQNYNTAARFTSPSKIKLFKYYDKNDTLICDLIPCYRKSDGVIGMYDKARSLFLTNVGTGTFTKGADV